MAKINATTIIRPADKDIDEPINGRIRWRRAVIAVSACKVYNLAAIRKRLEDCLRKLPANRED